MSEIERHSKFYEAREKASGPFFERAFDYERLAIEYTKSAFQALMYLNGGALVATPTAVALFKSDPASIKGQLLLAGAFFVAGLLAVCLSQSFAFFTMARRGEAYGNYAQEQQTAVEATHFPENTSQAKLVADLKSAREAGDGKLRASNVTRCWGIVFVFLSAALFVFGCFVGGRAILS